MCGSYHKLHVAPSPVVFPLLVSLSLPSASSKVFPFCFRERETNNARVLTNTCISCDIILKWKHNRSEYLKNDLYLNPSHFVTEYTAQQRTRAWLTWKHNLFSFFNGLKEEKKTLILKNWCELAHFTQTVLYMVNYTKCIHFSVAS